jgi:hypothetical protein
MHTDDNQKRRVSMFRSSILVLSALLLSACASEPTAPATAETQSAEAAKPRCDEPITGSHLKRCDRAGGVEVLTREEFERANRGRALPIPLETGTRGR